MSITALCIKCHYADCRNFIYGFAECFKPSVLMQNVFMLRVLMQSVVMLNVVMLSVVLPFALWVKFHSTALKTYQATTK